MDDPNPERTIRCCFLGDAAVGKTRMILASAKKGGGEEQMFFTYSTTMDIDGAPAKVELCDTQVDFCCFLFDFFFSSSSRLLLLLILCLGGSRMARPASACFQHERRGFFVLQRGFSFLIGQRDFKVGPCNSISQQTHHFARQQNGHAVQRGTRRQIAVKESQTRLKG
jgi:hypothetical protein